MIENYQLPDGIDTVEFDIRRDTGIMVRYDGHIGGSWRPATQQDLQILAPPKPSTNNLRVALRGEGRMTSVLLVDAAGVPLPNQQHSTLEDPLKHEACATITVRFIIDGRRIAYESETRSA